jgi:hypothetical protein
MFRKNVDQDLEDTIKTAYANLSSYPAHSPEYAAIADQLTKLYALTESNSKRRISPDTLVIVAGNLAGILLIVGHEQAHVVTSKALNFVLKAAR